MVKLPETEITVDWASVRKFWAVLLLIALFIMAMFSVPFSFMGFWFWLGAVVAKWYYARKA